CLWADQYKAGLLTHDEFKTLVAGRIVVMYMRDQTRSEGMRSLAEKTRKKWIGRLISLRCYSGLKGWQAPIFGAKFGVQISNSSCNIFRF
ncbi:MAG: hypothetical protein LBL45_00630, partial [Treponema sp.]|nr:hypothetical protein [Treponema sp.]